MGVWREAFRHGRPSELDVEYGLEYAFGPPATVEQLTAAEGKLGITLPDDVRGMLSEFNGVWYTSEVDRREGYEPTIVHLDLKHMSVEVPHYLRVCGNPLPAVDDLRRVVFVSQSNGFSVLWGVCLEVLNGFRAGQVVRLHHEVGELVPCANSWIEFVRDDK